MQHRADSDAEHSADERNFFLIITYIQHHKPTVSTTKLDNTDQSFFVTALQLSTAHNLGAFSDATVYSWRTTHNDHLSTAKLDTTDRASSSMSELSVGVRVGSACANHHLEYFVQQLERTVKLDLNPTRSVLDRRSRVVGTPALHKTESKDAQTSEVICAETHCR